MGQRWRTLRALLRLTHPLPTLLNAIAAAALATVAGAPPSVAALVALTMLGVHTFIGATNDYIDRDRDAGRPEKPLARGQLPPRAALLMAAAGLTAGLTAAAQVSRLTLVLATLGALVGFTYNVWMKRTALSWLPFAVGVSIIPAFAWSTVSSVLPAPILTLSLVALPGGAALALQNSLADRALDAERRRSTRRGARTRRARCAARGGVRRTSPNSTEQHLAAPPLRRRAAPGGWNRWERNALALDASTRVGDLRRCARSGRTLCRTGDRGGGRLSEHLMGG